MSKLSYIFDNRTRANQFLSSLDRQTIKSRFANMADWRPDHIVLVQKGDVVVAMADAISTEDNKSATASLISRPGYGAYAVKALLQLKRHVSRVGWFATLRDPTPSTIAISRRYFDMVMDQGAWELSNELMKEHGPQSHLMAAPIIASDMMMRHYDLPSFEKLNTASRKQVAMAVAKMPELTVRAPSGHCLGSQELMSLAFDIVELPFQHRQNITRLFLFGIATAHGYRPDPAAVRKFSNPSSLGKFHDAVDRYLTFSAHGEELFTLEKVKEDLMGNFARAVGSGSLPSNKRIS